MKFSLRDLCSLIFTLILITACAPDVMEPGDGDASQFGVVSYTAYADGVDTKAVLDGKVSKWQGEESIALVGKKGTHKFTAAVEGVSSQATFNYAGEGTYDETEVLAVYPYASGAYGGDFDDMYVSSVTIPSNQTAVAGSYDPSAAVAVAHSTNTTLKFKNATALLKFTMGSSGVKNVTVWGEMSEVEIEGEMPAYYKEGNVYLTVDPQWKSDGARFAAYFFGNGDTWRSMTAVSGQTNMYECTIPSGYTSVIFCRMNGGASTNNWDNKWNQTVDLKLSDGHMFTITNPWNGSGDKATGSWSTFSAEKIMSTAGISGAGAKVYYNNGEPVIERASEGYVSLNGDFQKGKTYYIAVAPVVFEKGFTVEFSDEGDYNKYAVKSTARRQQFKRNTIYDLGTLFSGKDTGFFTDPGMPDADKPCTIYYRPEEGDDLYDHTGDLYAHIWLRNVNTDSHGPTWGTNTDKYKMTLVGEKTWALKMEPSIREWFDEVSAIGTTPVQKIGIIARNSAGTVQTEDNFLPVYDSQYGVYMPENLQHGINVIDNSTVTLVLYDRDNQGKAHDFCNLLWDENWWGDSSKPKKPLRYDDESGCWWITLTGLNPDKQYKFQYQLGYGSDVTVTTFDPYTEILYDRSNDQWISSSTYPNLSQEYGDTHYGRDNGFVSAFKINRDEYDWQVEDYDIEDKNDLIIYELLVRDFTDNAYGEGSIKAAMGQLDYLETLGVNAIELMPVQEFDGNDSWGYGTHAYFAMDKAYGTRTDYKAFIDACHQRGMAVILDVVYNHATGVHPYAAMYWDGANNKTALNNPWFNVDAPHQWSVYHDWNHSNPMVREHVKRNLTYLMTEYKVDGFRFDLTKGFTQNSGTEESYDQSRVDIIKEYNAHIQSVDDDAVMICEHFVDEENWELGKDGIKVWRNMNHPYTKAMKRDMSQADFTGTTNGFDGNSGMQNDYMAFGTLVGFQESHDEQRTNYEGQWDYNGASIDFATRMERAKLNAAFFLLSPGPKMIWQFGEIGYDISIEDNGGRVNKKPCKTAEYMAVSERKALYDTYAMLIKFRKDNPRFFDYDVNFRWYVGSGEQTGRYLFARNGDGQHFALFGNFGKGSQNIGVELPSGVSKWYQYDNSSAVWTGSSHTTTMSEGQFYLLVSDQDMCLK